MYYSAGTYESFARPEKPKDVDKKSAYIIGTGLAGLSAAFYLVRDGQMKGEHIHVLEKLELAGGSCDGRKDITKGFFMRGGREMDNHFECMWDMYRDVPSIETPGISVLDEYYWLNKHDPNYSLCRASTNCGEDAHTDKKFELDKDSAMALSKLFMTPEKDLEDKKISDILPDSFWNTKSLKAAGRRRRKASRPEANPSQRKTETERHCSLHKEAEDALLSSSPPGTAEAYFGRCRYSRTAQKRLPHRTCRQRN